MNTTKEFHNHLCSVEIDYERKEITLHDFTDRINMPKSYSKAKRPFAKAAAALEHDWTPDTGFYAAIHILDALGMKMHSYCAMD